MHNVSNSLYEFNYKSKEVDIILYIMGNTVKNTVDGFLLIIYTIRNSQITIYGKKILLFVSTFCRF